MTEPVAANDFIRDIIRRDNEQGTYAVSYTHLTLPTICSV